jgi:DNA-binding NarL/FixJ family response regulator
MNARVLLVDDHKIFREGLRALIEKKPGIEVVGEAENGKMAIEMVDRLSPEVVIMDIAMPDMNGIEATRQIVDRTSHSVKVIGLTMHSDIRYVIRMLKAGASGFLLKDCSSEELVEAIKAVNAGETYLCEWVKENLAKDYINVLRGDKLPASSALTAREREVIELLADGKTIKEIASQLNVSPKTVEAHRQNIMEKLGINNTAELVKYAIREGFTSL